MVIDLLILFDLKFVSKKIILRVNCGNKKIVKRLISWNIPNRFFLLVDARRNTILQRPVWHFNFRKQLILYCRNGSFNILSFLSLLFLCYHPLYIQMKAWFRTIKLSLENDPHVKCVRKMVVWAQKKSSIAKSIYVWRT